MEKYDFSGWATRNDLLCVDGRTIKKDAFKNQNGKTVPLVWGHTHSDPNRVLGHAVLENRDEGVYAYCSFNDSESGLAAKKLVKHGDVRSLSICAGQLKQAGANVVHGVIYELSLVLAGANPGAFIDSVMEHGDASEDRMIIGYDENIMIYHSADEKEEKSETQEGKTSEEKTEEDEETVEQIFDTLSEKQKNVIYAMFGQAFGEPDKPEDKNDDSKGGKTEMKAYGVKSEDGRRFMKSEEISRSFMESPAYEILFEELVTNDKAAADFVNAVMNVGNSAATPMISTNTQN